MAKRAARVRRLGSYEEVEAVGLSVVRAASGDPEEKRDVADTGRDLAEESPIHAALPPVEL